MSAAQGRSEIASHRIASQPLLSDVKKEKGEDELGEKNSVLAQACIYCATCSAQVQHAESGPVKGERTHSAFKECKNTRVALLGFTRQLEKYEVRNDSSKRGMFGKSKCYSEMFRDSTRCFDDK